MSGQKKPPSSIHSPIENVVIIVKENHCFDNYFGTFPGAEGYKLAHSPNPPSLDPDHRHGAWLTRATTSIRRQFTENDIPRISPMGGSLPFATTTSPTSPGHPPPTT